MIINGIFKFKRYEDSSLSYTGIDKHEGKDVGGWDTVIKREEYERLFYNQQETMVAPAHEEPEEEEPENEPELPVKKQPIEPATPTNGPGLITTPNGIKPPQPATSTHTFVKEETGEEIDYDIVTVGMIVSHRVFGEGKVSWIDKAAKHIRVVFSAGEKTFLFPDAFKQGFLKLPENK